MLKYAIFAGALLCCTPSAYAQEVQAAAAQEPSVAHLMSLIDDQKDRIESQSKRIQELEDTNPLDLHLRLYESAEPRHPT